VEVFEEQAEKTVEPYVLNLHILGYQFLFIEDLLEWLSLIDSYLTQELITYSIRLLFQLTVSLLIQAYRNEREYQEYEDQNDDNGNCFSVKLVLNLPKETLIRSFVFLFFLILLIFIWDNCGVLP